MRTVKVAFSDALYAALEEQSRKEGQTGHSVASTVRRATRYWLSKNGHHATQLDMSDAEYSLPDSVASGYAETEILYEQHGPAMKRFTNPDADTGRIW